VCVYYNPDDSRSNKAKTTLYWSSYSSSVLYTAFSNDLPWHFHGHTYPPQGVPENSAIKSVLDYNIVFNPLPSGAASYIALGKKQKLILYLNFSFFEQPATLSNFEVRLGRKVCIG
jgi:hypothetical protein